MSMMEDSGEVDWVHLPEGVEEISLWDCLHDGEIVAFRLDRMARTIELDVTIDHLFDQDEQVVCTIQLDGVKSARIAVDCGWPGQLEVPKGTDRAEESRLISEFWAKSIELSINWQDFQASIAADPLAIANASYIVRGGAAALKISGFLERDPYQHQYCEARFRVGNITVRRKDEQPFSLGKLMELGSKYWEAFAARSKSRG